MVGDSVFASESARRAAWTPGVATEWRADRHAADVVVGGEPGGADRRPVQQACEDMGADRIQRVVLQVDRHALAFHEDFVAHGAQFRQRGIEVRHLDPERLQQRIVGVHSCSSPVSSR